MDLLNELNTKREDYSQALTQIQNDFVEAHSVLANLKKQYDIYKPVIGRLETEDRVLNEKQKSIEYSKKLEENIQLLLDDMLTSKRTVSVSREFAVRVTDSFNDESKSEGQFAVVSFAYIGGILKMLKDVENASRASKQGIITPENLEPNPKNPIISSFFRNIGRADRLGSGVRNLYKYSKYYSGAEPTFMEGDVFRIIVPLNDAYSFDFGQNGQSNQSNQTGLTEEEQKLLNWIKLNPDMTNALIAESLDWSVSKVKYYVQKLKRANKIKRAGTSRKGYWEVFGEEDN